MAVGVALTWPPEETWMDGVTCAVTETAATENGPADAVTPGSRVVAANSAGEAPVTVAVTSAPCYTATAWLKGALESASRPSASVAAAVEPNTTRPITRACTRRPDSPPRAARTTGRDVIWMLRSGVAGDPAVDDLDDPARVPRGQVGVVGDQDQRLSRGIQVEQQLADRLPVRPVQRPGRLVGQQQRGPVHQGPRDRHPLPLPARQPGGVGVLVLPDPQRRQQLTGT